ncbi:GFA family protein [Sphingomonas sp. Root241]|jgi:hypothetical protein|uniref:GFA family protein n=1 Tax=Sphingomonas sp. Root241 TaxID=1736501 RepID=UPI0006FEE77A|nr:GFA family protein [Sphingomonas sp. Root241]KRC80182.1 hypothetical protein ASE13_14310 [Sphingomonas sp. Root241]
MSAPRIATCWCGQLRAECHGEPVRISVCHCLNCQQRSGSAFAAQARFRVEQVRLSGTSTEWVHIGDSGRAASFHFCQTCGGTGWYRNASMPETIAVPIGNFADPDFPAPHFSVWEGRKHAWVTITGDGIEHD